MRTVTLYGEKAAGRVALIDDNDFELVNQYRWRILEEWRSGRNRGPYAIANIRRADGCLTTLRMHCLIMGCTEIDHCDGNGLNNQQYNLRVATDSQNHGNERPGTGGTSRFKGVYWDRHRQKWQAAVKVDRKKHYLGRFEDEEDAARAYDAAALEAWGEYAWLNFRELRQLG